MNVGTADFALRERAGLQPLDGAVDLAEFALGAFLDRVQEFVVFQNDRCVRRVARQRYGFSPEVTVYPLEALTKLCASGHQPGTRIPKLFVADCVHGAIVAAPGRDVHAIRYLRCQGYSVLPGPLPPLILATCSRGKPRP